jgi:DNA-binding NtrC family response regulator
MRVLIVEDDRNQRERCVALVEAQGHETQSAVDGAEGLEKAAKFRPDLIVTDLRMPKVDGFEFLKALREAGNPAQTIVLTAFGSVEMALQVVHDLGGFWFLEKPVDGRSLQVLLERAAAHGKLKTEVVELRRQLSFQGSIGEMVGKSRAMQRIFGLIRQAAPSNAPVLVTGESGTGKELVARGLHSLSRRADQPFIAINCAAIPDSLVESELFGHEKGAFTGAVERRIGCMEQAHGGTLFLDEIGEMPLAVQAKLLRVVEELTLRRLGGKQEIAVDFRLIAATNREPLRAIAEQRLREDLYYRINVFHIELPPLRERREDIEAIANSMLSRLNAKHETRVVGLDDEALRLLGEQPWPGNIRQLRNVVERAVIIAGEGLVQAHHLWLPAAEVAGEPESETVVAPPFVAGVDCLVDVRVGNTIEEGERKLIEATLTFANNNKTRSAGILGISAKTLHAKINQYKAI